MAWTSHGHLVPGTQMTGDRPDRVGCGGPSVCVICDAEVNDYTALNYTALMAGASRVVAPAVEEVYLSISFMRIPRLEAERIVARVMAMAGARSVNVHYDVPSDVVIVTGDE